MIHVFKTSVSSKKAVRHLSPFLNQILPSSWNFDLEDCDKILRLKTSVEVAETVRKLLQEQGFACEELSD